MLLFSCSSNSSLKVTLDQFQLINSCNHPILVLPIFWLCIKFLVKTGFFLKSSDNCSSVICFSSLPRGLLIMLCFDASNRTRRKRFWRTDFLQGLFSSATVELENPSISTLLVNVLLHFPHHIFGFVFGRSVLRSKVIGKRYFTFRFFLSSICFQCRLWWNYPNMFLVSWGPLSISL